MPRVTPELQYVHGTQLNHGLVCRISLVRQAQHSLPPIEALLGVRQAVCSVGGDIFRCPCVQFYPYPGEKCLAPIILNFGSDILPLQEQLQDPLTPIDSCPQERYSAAIILSARVHKDEIYPSAEIQSLNASKFLEIKILR